MRNALFVLPDDCARALTIGRLAPLLTPSTPNRSLVIVGAGTGALVGEYLQALLAEHAPFPVSVVQGYHLPAWVGANTQVIVLSETGSEEEVIYAISDASDKGTRVAALTGGGHVQDIAESQGFPFLRLPDGAFSTGLGRLFFALWGWLGVSGLLPAGWAGDTEDALAALRRQRDLFAETVPQERNPSRQVAEVLRETIPIFWASPGPLAACAGRWKASWNTVARVPAFCRAFPGLEYDEFLTMSHPAEDMGVFSLVLLRDRADSTQVTARIEAIKQEIEAAQPDLPIHDIFADGASALTRLWTATYLGDCAASYLAS